MIEPGLYKVMKGYHVGQLWTILEVLNTTVFDQSLGLIRGVRIMDEDGHVVSTLVKADRDLERIL